MPDKEWKDLYIGLVENVAKANFAFILLLAKPDEESLKGLLSNLTECCDYVTANDARYKALCELGELSGDGE